MKIIKNSIIILGLLLFISCDKKRVFDEYKSVKNEWHKDSILKFDIPKLDASKKYNVFLNIRDNNNFPYSNIFLIVSLEQPNKKILVDTLEYQMANPDGTLMGEGFSDIKENKLVYKENMAFNQKGAYKITVQQASRQTGKVAGVTKLNGITEVGVRIENTP